MKAGEMMLVTYMKTILVKRWHVVTMTEFILVNALTPMTSAERILNPVQH
jgi:hypothetical protein